MTVAMLLADYLDDQQQQHQPASGQYRSASVSIALPALSPVSTAPPDVPATPRSVLTCYGCRLDFNAAGTILPLLVRQRARDVP